MTEECCVLERGDIYIGSPMNPDGKSYADSFGWGDQWGISWGGNQTAIQPAGMAALPPSRYVGNANLSWTPNFKDIPAPVRYSMSSYDNCATKILDSMSISLTLYCKSAANQALEFGGDSETSIAAATVVDEVIYFKPGSVLDGYTLLPFSKSPFDSTQSTLVSLQNIVTGVKTPLVYGTDYEYSMFGIKLMKSLSVATDAQIVASYTSLPSTVQDGFNDCPLDASLTIEARNLVANCAEDSGQNYQGRIGYFFPRVRLVPTGTRTLFGDSEFQSITLEGEVKPVWVNGSERYMRKYKI
jgi:hypothetical protein